MMKDRTRERLYTAARGLPHYPWQVTVGSLAVAGLAALFALAEWFYPTLIAAGLAGLAFIISHVFWYVRHVAMPWTAVGWVARQAEWAQRTGGMAGMVDIAQHASATWLRRQAATLRPSLAHLRPRKVPTTELGVELGRLGGAGPTRFVYLSCESTSTRIGGPRSWKTSTLVPYGLDAPGALITTSTRLDLAEGVQPARWRRSVWIFNPSGLGDIPSNISWSVLLGCEDFAVATRRAGVLIPPNAANSDHEHWAEAARRILAILMNAAALAGHDMTQVAEWIAADSDTARDEIVDILRGEELGGQQRAQTILAHFATNDRTRTSVTHTMKPGIAWLGEPAARAIGDAPIGAADLLDLQSMIRHGETLHLLGHSAEGSPLAPLIACLVGEIAHAARAIASGRRIDPPVRLLLDEAALVCPIPLPDWMADFGGAGIEVHVSVQSVSQLEKRWGKTGAQTILTTSNALLVFGGSNNNDELEDISNLAGEHLRKVIKGDDEGDFRTDQRWMRVRSAAELRALPPGMALVLRSNLLPVVVRAQTARDRQVAPMPLPGDPHAAALGANSARRTLFRRHRDAITIPAQNGHEAAHDADDIREDANDG